MGLKGWMRRIERAAQGEVESFELLDGSRYYYDAMEVYKAVFLHGIDCLTAESVEDWPEPPEVYLRLCEARDLETVLERLTSAPIVEFPYDPEILISERYLVPVEHEPVEDLSP
jgi:hypothetical protein